MRAGVTVAGHRLTGRTRVSEAGTWADAVSPDGRPSGVLRFDPAAVAAAQTRERLVATIGADLRLRHGGPVGLLPVIDLVAARDEVWLITARAAPTLGDLITGGRVDAGSAATILVETAQTLLTLHAAGLTHGALGPGTIVVSEDGAALLAERGLLAALRGQPAQAEGDVAAWAELAGELSRVLAAGGAHGDEAALLRGAAAAATTRGLAAARDTLLHTGRETLPHGFMSRDWLAATARGFPAAVSPAVSPASSPAAPPAAPPAVPPGPGFAGGEVKTLLDLPSTHASAQAAAQDPMPKTGEPVTVRFGPGVPAETTAAQIWRSGRTSAAVTHPQTGAAAPRRRRRRTTAWAGTLLLAILIAAGILWLRLTPPAEVMVSEVDVRAPKKTVRCDGTADFVGVVATNGGAGTIRYVWIRSDDRKPLEQERQVRSGETPVSLPLHWKVSGPGSFKGTATLRVLSPTTSGKPMQDKASFSYKC